ncbi:C-terminal helicase domain-containing protein [Akkermansiaceae bacterium]|nr:C-terminal helicase domain-containing protein [Akkermansiaceae bacterium]MDB4499087.1 C-terminal helicase domain-containing protein [Akkermansiaceae bacterium]
MRCYFIFRRALLGYREAVAMPIKNQSIHEVFDHQKVDLLHHLLESTDDLHCVIVFLRSRDGVHALTASLNNAGVKVASLHGNKKIELRERALKELKDGTIRVLVATEAVVRLLNISGVRHIIQFEFHELGDDYLKRVAAVEPQGGEVTTFVTPGDASHLLKLEEFVGEELPRKIAPDFVYDAQPKKGKILGDDSNRSNKTSSKPLQHKKPKLKNKGPRRKTGRTRKK